VSFHSNPGDGGYIDALSANGHELRTINSGNSDIERVYIRTILMLEK
jgi:hypothetical protein